MRALIVADDGQFERNERALAELAALPAAMQLRRAALVEALRSERAELLRYNPQLRSGGRATERLGAH